MFEGFLKENLENPRFVQVFWRLSREFLWLAPEFLKRLGVFVARKILKSRSDEILVSDTHKI